MLHETQRKDKQRTPRIVVDKEEKTRSDLDILWQILTYLILLPILSSVNRVMNFPGYMLVSHFKVITPCLKENPKKIGIIIFKQ